MRWEKSGYFQWLNRLIVRHQLGLGGCVTRDENAHDEVKVTEDVVGYALSRALPIERK